MNHSGGQQFHLSSPDCRRLKLSPSSRQTIPSVPLDHHLIRCVSPP